MTNKKNTIRRMISRLPVISQILEIREKVRKFIKTQNQLNQQFNQLQQRVWPKRELFLPTEKDIYLVSYPRSGNTWLRVILAEILYGASGESMRDLNYYIPDIHIRTYRDELINSDFYIVKSHFRCLLLDPEIKRYKNVLYLIRDPRDVVLSYYEYSKKLRDYKFGLEQFLIDFLEGRIAPGSWQEHVNSWIGRRAKDEKFRLCIVRYENLLSDTYNELVKIFDFIGISAKRENVERAINKASVEKMRVREEKGMSKSEKAEGFHFIGLATSNQWKGKLTLTQLDLIKKYAGAVMKKYGYE